ncbi:MAG: FeoB-associated Cys-rich membrane protein [Peptococcaceae bacterium]|jgi:hypothetical protein|nr:FeoB-associated Cys-rich membrane protein [Peptococcaceae bacterium]
MLSEVLGTLIVGLVLLGIVAAIVAGLIRDKRKGKNISRGGCGRGCDGCVYASGCYSAPAGEGKGGDGGESVK